MINVHILNLKEFDKKSALRLLPQKVIIHAKSLRSEQKHSEYIASNWLRYKLLSRLMGVNIFELKFSHCKNGRPFLMNSPFDFNISHTRNYIAIAIAKQQRVGIDIQQIKKNTNFLAIAKQYFSKQEYQFIMSHKSTERKERVFYWLWVHKESSIKLKGGSVFKGLRYHSFFVDHYGLCKEFNIRGRMYFHQELLDNKTFLCVSFEKNKSKIIYTYIRGSAQRSSLNREKYFD